MFWSLFYHFYRWYVTAFESWFACTFVTCCSITHTHPFNGPFSGTTQVSRYQKGKTNLDFTEARDSEWQWHQLGHMQVCTSLQTDNHASTLPLSFLQAGCPSCCLTNSVKALKAVLLFNKYSKYLICHLTSSCIGCKLQKLSYAVGQIWLQTATLPQRSLLHEENQGDWLVQIDLEVMQWGAVNVILQCNVNLSVLHMCLTALFRDYPGELVPER